ncbi:MAG: hypothetical protein MUP85_15950 [Candidatus Lokiarchaeota archaeon]|nr:hypothetical protein [Candidatus Lokiarchaeota archaeon]
MNTNEQFHRVDLHIHTPASNCYEGIKNDDEYIKILKKIIVEKIKIVSFTDHNSIGGYKKIKQLQKSLEKKKGELESKIKEGESNGELEKIKAKLKLFAQVLILPGIEFDAKPGIHILIIFNPNIPIDTIEEFLIKGGYDIDNSGQEDPIKLSKWDVINLFEEASKLDCILIDAHSDSNKGIYNELKGKFRATCFSSPHLNAIGYKNARQRGVIQSLIYDNKDYKRSIPIAFVKFTDSHSINEIGKHYTWFKLKDIDYDSLKFAFGNSDEYISVEAPSTKKILDRLIKGKNSFGIQDLSDNSKYEAQ